MGLKVVPDDEAGSRLEGGSPVRLYVRAGRPSHTVNRCEDNHEYFHVHFIFIHGLGRVWG